jgi:hypothetical protein
MPERRSPQLRRRSPPRPLLLWLAVVLGGVLLGVASAAAILVAGAVGDVRSGAWTTNLTSGSSETGMHHRARVAVAGLMALSKQEALYWVAFTDDQGAPLTGSCDYRLQGSDVPARWWSITAYGADSYLIPNPAARYSFSKTTVERAADGSFVIHVSSQEQGPNWLPVAAGERFDLTARLYNPEPAVYANPERTSLPTITKVSCR